MRLFDEVVRRCTLAVIALACMMLPLNDRHRWKLEWSAEAQAILSEPAIAQVHRRALEALRFVLGLPKAAYRERATARAESLGLLFAAILCFVGSLVTRRLPAENLLTVAGDLLMTAAVVAWLSRSNRFNHSGK